MGGSVNHLPDADAAFLRDVSYTCRDDYPKRYRQLQKIAKRLERLSMIERAARDAWDGWRIGENTAGPTHRLRDALAPPAPSEEQR